jgi:prepilin-type N-terminal cleavage/methylation domain-containing protein
MPNGSRPARPYAARQNAFTLIEMLVVMTIVALLLTIALPRYFSSLDRSKVAVLQENLRILRVSLDKFYADKGNYPENLNELVEKKYLRALPVDPITESNQSWIAVPSANADQGGVADVKSGAKGATTDGKAYDAM